MPIKNNVIEASNVSFHYDGHLVLENVTFNIESGDYLGIIGPNGGGKTTLIKLILGLLKPTKGTVKISGFNANSFKGKGLVGYVPQRVSQDISKFPATVEEIVSSGRTARLGFFKRFKSEDRAAIEKAMEVAGITRHRKHALSDLSGGERQRVFIARALAGEPKILVLDEPSVGVDLAARENFYSFIKNLNKKGLTIVFASHDIGFVAHETKTLLCLNKKLVCHGDPKKFLKKEYIEKLYGKKVKFIIHNH